MQEAHAATLVAWARDGIPQNPVGWLTTTARRRAVDALRREHALRAKLPLLVEPATGDDCARADEAAIEELGYVVTDERLRLIFLCCHPALARDVQMALTLRLVCGVSTKDIAQVFLVSESTMAAG